MNDFDLALVIIGDYELQRRKTLMQLEAAQRRVAELEAQVDEEQKQES